MSNSELTRVERLDQRVIKQLPALSRAFAVKLIERGSVSVNGRPEHKAGHKLRPADNVIVDYDATAITIPTIDLPVLYEDDNCVVINKPAEILSHSKGAFNPEATVASWLQPRLNGLQGDRAGIVHRLDRATSGVMICAKTPEAMAWLQKQFSQRKVKKTYIALIEGVLNPAQAIIDMPIERHPKKPQTFRVGSHGKAATTAYKVLKTSNKYSLVELSPTTGRTHQLRVHLQHLGHPIVGDTLYGSPYRSAERLFLHAKSLELTLPNRQRQVFSVPVPPMFNSKLQS